MNIDNRISNYAKVSKAISNKVESFIELVEIIKDIKEGNFETIVFKKYIELSEVKEVTKYINDNGYRVKTGTHVGERKYIHNDISDILNNKKLCIDSRLYDAVELMRELDKILIKINYKNLIK